MKVYVRTPARLHFGLIDMRGDLGRFFGGLGVAIDKPNVVLEVQPSESFSVTGEETERATMFARRFLEAYEIEGGFNIHVEKTIPEHVGLGSGTQLALAIAAALARLFKVTVPIPELSLSMERIKRTGVGTAVFEQGGFVVDGGKKMKNKVIIPQSLPPLIFRRSFPNDWKFIVAIPPVEKGLSRNEEKEAFNRISPMPTEVVGKICRLIMMQLLPSLIDRDIHNFGDALTQIQVTVGKYFADVQGGIFSSSIAASGINFMKDHGACGVGQSSWGPTVYGLVEGKKQARNLQSELENFLRKDGYNGKVFIANPNNCGAIVKQV